MITRILAGDPIIGAFARFAMFLASNSVAYQRDIAQANHYMAKFKVNANIVKNFRKIEPKSEAFYQELRIFYGALQQYTRYYLSKTHQYDEEAAADDIFDFIKTHLNTAQEIESFYASEDLLPREHIIYVEYSPHILARLLGWSTTLLMLGGGGYYMMNQHDTDEPLTTPEKVACGCLLLTACVLGHTTTYFANKMIDPPQAPTQAPKKRL